MAWPVVNATLRWKFFIWKCFSSSIIVGGMGLIACLTGVDWTTLHNSQKVVIGTTIVVAILKNLDSLVDRTFTDTKNGTHPADPPK